MNNFTVLCPSNHKTRFFLDELPMVDGQSWLYGTADVIATTEEFPSRKCARVFRLRFGLKAPIPSPGVDIDHEVQTFAAALEPMTIIAGLI
jgi:hypothetical protein